MNRTIYTEKGNIKLLYAESDDRRLIYDMAFEEPEIWQSMLAKKEDFPWELIRDEKDCFFGNTPGTSKYLLIQYQGEIIGVISHTYNDGKIENLELDTWLRSGKYTGKGIGSAAMKLLIDSLVQDFGIKTFIIRPWVKNPRAIKAYEKCGFRQTTQFVPSDYYGTYLELWGNGDYGETETANMTLTAD